MIGGKGQKTVHTIYALCTYEFDTDHSKQYYLCIKMCRNDPHIGIN